MTKDELLELLKARKALIVHCSRPGKADEGLGGLLFPDDLKNAIEMCANEGKELSCSLIWPAHTHTFGAIGIILKPRSTASIASISPDDAGTAYDSVTGTPFSRHAVEETFLKASDYNEWTVTDADTIGIFVNLTESLVVAKVVPFTEIPGFDPSMADLGLVVGQVELKLAEIIAAFPGLPVYGFLGTEIIEIGIDAAQFYS